MPTLLPLATAEPAATAVMLTVLGILLGFGVLFARTLDRAGVPVVLLFLVLGMLGGSEAVGGVAFTDHELAFRLGTIALALILLDGGLNTSWAAIRQSALPAGILATVGVLGTAACVAVCARLLGMPWGEALLIGAIVSSTDAAAVFSVLRGGNLELVGKTRPVLEVESCVNDPVAVILTGAVLASLDGHPSPWWWLALFVPLQLVTGGAIGALVGEATRWTLLRLRLSTAGLVPIVTLASAFLAFGLATLAYGSGFLAVFTAGVVLGNGELPYRTALARIHDAIAWICQVGLFLMLGLLVFPSQLVPVAGVGLLLGLALAFVGRPLVVFLCLLPFRLPLRQAAYVGWVGLRGGVPIVLATIPVMAGRPEGERLFHIVFFIVVVSTLVPGATIAPLAKLLRLGQRAPDPPAAALEVHSLRQVDGEIHGFQVTQQVAVCGASFAEIQFPPHSAAILVLRGDELLAARGPTRLQPGDHVYVFCRKSDLAYIRLLFGRTLDG